MVAHVLQWLNSSHHWAFGSTQLLRRNTWESCSPISAFEFFLDLNTGLYFIFLFFPITHFLFHWTEALPNNLCCVLILNNKKRYQTVTRPLLADMSSKNGVRFSSKSEDLGSPPQTMQKKRRPSCAWLIECVC
ncbi:hypothetical protein ILYODFUR_004331 [Ilyodon furcidens]|uniref:Uncharacterized protein n=1 Tax=Ilyodon furcidens TaxID=33524 RepID=A0ABV0SIF4_9TELE